MGYLFAKYSVNNEEVNIERIDEASDTGFDSLMEKYDLNLKNAETYEFSENGWRKASKKNR